MGNGTVPDQIADMLLWRQARQVIAAHQPQPHRPDRCANLGCRDAAWPCPAHRLAQRAARTARARPPATVPPGLPWATDTPSTTSSQTVTGRSIPAPPHTVPTPPTTWTPSAPATGADLATARPERLQIGDVGVFAGSWAWTGPDPQTMRVGLGYVGTLEDWWNGWAVWSTSRDVVEAMVAEQHRLRHVEQQRLAAEGHHGDQTTTALDHALPPMFLDGDDLVVDQHAAFAFAPPVRHRRDRRGRYTPMGRRWAWAPVDPARCDRVAGRLPAR